MASRWTSYRWPKWRCSPDLPKAPSSYNPVANPERAKLRQQYVLRHMHELKYISDQQLAAALQEQVLVHRTQQGFDTSAALYG